MSNEFYETIPAKQCMKYDPDSSPLAWRHYKKVYTSEHWGLLNP